MLKNCGGVHKTYQWQCKSKSKTGSEKGMKKEGSLYHRKAGPELEAPETTYKTKTEKIWRKMVKAEAETVEKT